MDIKKISGIGGITPEGKPGSTGRTDKVDFKKALDEVVKSGKTKKGKEVKDIMAPEKLKSIREKMQSGYYDRDEVISQTAEKLIGGEESK